MTATFQLREQRDVDFAIRYIQKQTLNGKTEVIIRRAGRTAEQNKLLHSTLTDIAVQLEWPPGSGQFQSLDWWKRRATLQWLIELKKEVEVVTSLEGNEVGLLLPHTSDLTVDECVSLNEWVFSFGAQNGVVFREPLRTPEPPPWIDER